MSNAFLCFLGDLSDLHVRTINYADKNFNVRRRSFNVAVSTNSAINGLTAAQYTVVVIMVFQSDEWLIATLFMDSVTAFDIPFHRMIPNFPFVI